jgi:hypothetical protein
VTDRPQPVHRRTITFEAFELADALEVVGTLRDERPWAEGTEGVALVHDLELAVTVELAGLRIRSAHATMRTFPHAECPAIAPAMAGLAGLSVGRGYTRAVQERFGGPLGCSHLEHLARALGPVVIQSATSVRARQVVEGTAPDLLGAGGAWMTGTCHIWAEGGVAQAKLAAGWRPGRGPYPAPEVATFHAGTDEPDA